METNNLICIRCPVGCALRVDIQNGEVVNVQGHTCKRGEEYAKKECIAPTRTITTTVPVTGGEIKILPVRTAADIPKDKIFACMACLADITVKAPVNIGDVVVDNAADTGIAIIATRNVLAI